MSTTVACFTRDTPCSAQVSEEERLAQPARLHGSVRPGQRHIEAPVERDRLAENQERCRKTPCEDTSWTNCLSFNSRAFVSAEEQALQQTGQQEEPEQREPHRGGRYAAKRCDVRSPPANEIAAARSSRCREERLFV